MKRITYVGLKKLFLPYDRLRFDAMCRYLDAKEARERGEKVSRCHVQACETLYNFMQEITRYPRPRDPERELLAMLEELKELAPSEHVRVSRLLRELVTRWDTPFKRSITPSWERMGKVGAPGRDIQPIGE
jgi:hypothetical protein